MKKRKLFRLITTSDSAVYEIEKEKKIKTDIMKIKRAREVIKPSKVVATCFAARRPGFYLINAYFLVFLITTITFCNWAVNFFYTYYRLQTTFYILLMSVQFKWVVNR